MAEKGRLNEGQTSLGVLYNPLSDWPNDDLLLTEDGLENFKLHHPKAVPVFHWPELLALFEDIDPEASTLRTKSRRHGFLAVLLGLASLTVGAFIPLFDTSSGALWWAGLAAATLAVASGAVGYAGALIGRSKFRWIQHRFWTERLRQLHFQLIINNLDAAVEAMRSPLGLERWNELRRAVLADFEHQMRNRIGQKLLVSLSDVADAMPWLQEEWGKVSQPPPPSEELDEIMRCFCRQRFEIQISYCSLKLHEGIRSPKTRSVAANLTMEISTMLILMLAAALGGTLVAGYPLDHLLPKSLLVGSGVLSAIVLAVRALEEGMQLDNEADRYEWYQAAVKNTLEEFKISPHSSRQELMRAMERLSYQEMRGFIDAFVGARFII